MTIISHRHKFIFVCPRKVAGTSLRIALARHCGAADVILGDETYRRGLDADDFGVLVAQNTEAFADTEIAGWLSPHILPDTIRARVGARVWDEYFKFTVVRNPWDLFVSFHRYKLLVDWPNIQHAGGTRVRGWFGNVRRRARLRRALRDLQRGRCKESVEFALRKGLFAPLVAEIPQFYFCHGRRYADHYLRFESLQRDYDEVCRSLGLPRKTLPRAKTGVRKRGDDYRACYTDYSKEHIAAICRRMVHEFGYRFERV